MKRLQQWALLSGLSPLYHTHPLLFFSILLFSTSLAVAHLWIPQLPLYISVGCAYILNAYFIKDYTRANLYTLLALLASILLYGILINTTSLGLYSATENTIYLCLYASAVLYFTSFKGNFVEEWFQRTKQCVLAITYGVAFVATMEIMTFFIDSIFLTQWMSHQLLQHSILALASFFFLTILCTYDPPLQQTSSKPSKFYDALINRYLPVLSIISTGLAIIYLTLMFFGIRDDHRFLYTYYPYITIYFFFFMASYRQENLRSYHSLSLILFMVLTAVCMAFTIKRQYLYPSQQISSLYPLLINGAFFIYTVHLFRSKNYPNRTFSYFLLALGFVMFTPILGYTSYHQFVTYTKTDTNYLSHYEPWHAFSESKPPEIDTFKTATKQRLENIEMTHSFHSTHTTPLSIEGHRQLYVDSDVYTSNTESHQLGEYTITLNHQNNTISITNNDHTTTYTLEDVIPHQTADTSATVVAPIPLLGSTYTLYITDYYHSEKATSLHFHFLIK